MAVWTHRAKVVNGFPRKKRLGPLICKGWDLIGVPYRLLLGLFEEDL
jgi:hypothetical protein